MDLCPVPRWTLDEYYSERVVLTSVNRFDAMAVGGWNLEIYDRTRFERDTVLGARKRR